MPELRNNSNGNPLALRLWLIRRLMPRGYQLCRKLVMGVPPPECPHCGKPWGPEHHDYVSGIGYEGCRA